jgi:hypothetical protein
MPPQPPRVVSPSPAELLPPREAEALSALNSTRISKGTRALLISGFLVISFSGMLTSLWNAVLGTGEKNSSSGRHFFGEPLARREDTSENPGVGDLWRWLPSPAAIQRAEKDLEQRSIVATALRPRVQALLFRVFRMGNEQVEPAPEGWLFFRRDLDYVNGRPFLEAAARNAMEGRGSISPDSLAALTEFHNQLASRGIRLLVVPVPVKPCIEGHRMRPVGNPAAIPLHNPSYAVWLEALAERGISVFDPGPLLQERAQRTGEPQFLRTDTHWTPESMQAVAEAIALRILPGPSAASREGSVLRSAQITAHGDTVALLGLLEKQELIPPQTVTIQQPVHNGGLWKQDPDGDVLLLGDSFSNIYSLAAMGWGEGAGLAEHLGARLGRPIDALLRNSDGAFATRQMLQKELASGNDRLAGKRFVIWEFAVRELAFGDWKSLSLDVPQGRGRTFFCPPPGTKQRVRGVVSRVSAMPRPGTVPYKEHIVALHLVDVVTEGQPADKPFECVIYTWSMREQRPLSASQLQIGAVISAEIQPWEDVSEVLEKFQRSELDRPEFLLEPANWAEVLH